MQANNNVYRLDLENLKGDFIVNNALADLTYINVGTTNMKIDGKDNKVNYFLTKNLSDDSSEVFVDDNTYFKSSIISLWDENNNFYSVDTSDVISDVSKSHKWGIYKNNKTQVMKKIVGNIKLVASNDKPNISLVIPDFNNASFTLHKNKNQERGDNYCLISGQIKDKSGVRNVRGIYFVRDYTE